MKVYGLDRSRWALGRRAYHWPRRGWMGTFVLKGTYPLQTVPNAPSRPRIPMRGVRRRERTSTAEEVYPGDYSPFKDRGEFLVLQARARPPEGKAAAFGAGVSLGPLVKRLALFGPRGRNRVRGADSMGSPGEVEEVPLEWRYAWGGPDEPRNPVGVGADPADPWCPQVEDPAGKERPMGLGPLRADWEPRQSRKGTYGREWLRHRWPWFPEDTDPRHFCQASDDQQLSEGVYWQGTEAWWLENLVPHEPWMRGELPGEVLRLWVSEDEDPYLSLRADEVRLRLDTVHFFPEEGYLTVLWRGLRAVEGPKMREIRRLLVRTESYPGSHRAEAEILAEWTSLLPEKEPNRRETVVRAAPEDREGGARSGPEKAEPEPVADPVPGIADFYSLAQQFLAREGLGGTGSPEHGPSPEELEQHPSSQIARELTELPPEKRSAELTEALESLQQEEDRFDKEMAEADRVAERKRREMAEQNEIRNRGAFWWPDEELGRPPRIPPGEKATVADVERLRREGRSLAGLDLSGLLLKEKDLRGADLRGADLSGADLSGADLEGARLVRAKLADCSLAGANLSRADLSMVDLTEAILVGATTHGWRIHSANLGGQDFRGRLLRDWEAYRADLRGVRLREARVEGGDWGKVGMQEADCCASRWSGVNLTGVRARGSQWNGAVLEDARLTNARLRKADLRDGSWVRCMGIGPNLAAADLRGFQARQCRLPRLRAGETRVDGGRFHCCDLSRSSWEDTEGIGTLWSGCSLFRSAFGRARLTQSEWWGCQLFRSSFLGAMLNNCRFPGSDVRQTLVATSLAGDGPAQIVWRDGES